MTNPRQLKVCIHHDLQIGGALRAAVEFTRATSDRISYSAVLPDRSEPLALWRAHGLGVDAVPWPPRLLRMIAEGGSVRRGLEIVLSGTLSRRIRRRLPPTADLLLVYPSHLLQAPGIVRKAIEPTVYYAHEPRRRSFEPGYNRVPPSGLGEWAKLALSDAFEPWLRWQDRRAVAAATHLFCNSEYTRQRLKECYGRDAVVVHLGVDADLFCPDLGAPRESMVLSVGGLEPSKGHDLLIRAVGTLPAPRRPVVTIVHDRGTSTYRATLVRLAHEQGVELVLRASVTTRELVDLYRRAAATFCGAAGEPFGLTPLESIACGTPVVAVAAGGYLETVQDGVNGRLIANSAAKAGQAIDEALYGVPLDPWAIRKTILPYWTWTAAGDRLVNALRGALDGPNGGKAQ